MPGGIPGYVEMSIERFVEPGFVATSDVSLSGLAALIAGGGDAIAAALGFAAAPVFGWAGSGEDAPVTIVGETSLSEVGTPTYGFESENFNAPLTRFDAGSTDAFVAGDTTPCNPGDNSFFWLYVGLLGAAPAATRMIAGCRGGGVGGSGWDFAAGADGSVRFGVRATSAFYSRTVAGRASSKLIALGAYDKTNTNWALYTDDGDAAPGGLPANPPAVSDSPFAIGAQFFLLSAPHDFGLFYWWDAGGEGLNGTHVANLKSFLGWE